MPLGAIAERPFEPLAQCIDCDCPLLWVGTWQVAILGPDARSERTKKQIISAAAYEMIFERHGPALASSVSLGPSCSACNVQGRAGIAILFSALPDSVSRL